MDLSPVKALIFDKDGTLFDFHATWSAWAANALRDLAEGDEAVAGRLAELLGYDLPSETFREDSSVIAGTLDEQALKLSSALPGRTPQEITLRLVELARDVPQVEVTPLAPLLERLNGYTFGVATNDAEIVAHAQLRRAGITDFFTFVAGADSGFGGKPETGQLHAFAEATGLAPHEIAMIGDSTHDLFAARAAGMVAVGVLTGPAGHAQLAPHADHVIASIAELPDLLR